MKTYSFFHEQTGAIHPRIFSSNDDRAIALNTPAGHQPIEGTLDWQSQKVDLKSGQVVDYQPPAPSAAHVWDATKKRWILGADTVNKARSVATAKAEIAQLEALHNGAVRDFLLRGDKSKLEAIDAKIAQLRSSIE